MATVREKKPHENEKLVLTCQELTWFFRNNNLRWWIVNGLFMEKEWVKFGYFAPGYINCSKLLKEVSKNKNGYYWKIKNGVKRRGLSMIYSTSIECQALVCFPESLRNAAKAVSSFLEKQSFEALNTPDNLQILKELRTLLDTFEMELHLYIRNHEDFIKFVKSSWKK